MVFQPELKKQLESNAARFFSKKENGLYFSPKWNLSYTTFTIYYSFAFMVIRSTVLILLNCAHLSEARKVFKTWEYLIWPPLWKSTVTWHGGHVGVPKQRNGSHVGVLNQSFGNWTLFLCKCTLLFSLKNMLIVHLSENSAWSNCVIHYICKIIPHMRSVARVFQRES